MSLKKLLIYAAASAAPIMAAGSDPVVPAVERCRWEAIQEALRLPLARETGAGDVDALLRGFLFDFPASPLRQVALLEYADAAYDRGDYPLALKRYGAVAPEALDADRAEDYLYRRAYCLLKTGEYGAASRSYRELEGTGRYGSEARFYQGYIAYAEGDYREAVRILSGVRRAPGTPTADAGYYLAQSLLMTGDYSAAAREARGLLKGGSCPAEYRAETRRVLGEALYGMGDRREAVQELTAYAKETDRPKASALYVLGVNDFHNGDYRRAVERLAPATELDSEMGQSALVYSGEAYMRDGDYSAASVLLDRACRMDFSPELSETAHYDYAMAKASGGRVPFGSTVGLFEDFLKRFPGSRRAAEVQKYVVNGYVTDNNYAAALAAINRIPKPGEEILRAKQTVLYNLGARELRQGDAAKALPRLREAASMGRYNGALAAEARLWEGQALYRLGRYREAAESFNGYLRSDRRTAVNRALAYYDLGYARFGLKEFPAAKQDFEKYLEISSKDSGNREQRADALNRVADCEYYAGDFATADATYLRAYELDPATGDYPMYQQGLMKGLRRDHAGKISTLTEMTRRFPNSALMPSALLEIGQSHAETGDTESAIEVYRRLAERYPQTAQGRQGELLLAISYLNTGRRGEAVAAYKRVISSYPTSEEARAAADDLKMIYADDGRIQEYVSFLGSVPDAPKMEQGEVARLTLISAEKALEDGRRADALARATELAEQFPDSPEAVRALLIKAEAELQGGDPESALRSYRQLEAKASDAADINAARMGMLRVSHTLGLSEDVVETAGRVLASSSVGSAEKREASFDKAMALSALGHDGEAAEIWDDLAADMGDLYGAKAAYYRAQRHFDKGQTEKALREVNELIDANPPHDYWLARGFILLSDIQRAKGDDYQADAYLRSLRGNYPGSEPDIFEMIDSRLTSSASK